MKPDPPSATASPYASAAPAAGMTCRQRSRDQVSAARRGRRSRATSSAGHDAAERRRSRSPRAAASPRCARRRSPIRRRRSATAANSSGTQMPSLSPLSTLSPWRIRPGTRGVGDDRLPERGVGRREDHGQDHRLPDRELVEERRRPRRRRARSSAAGRCRAGAAGTPSLAAKLAEVDARGVAEQHERERRLRQRPHGLARASTSIPSSTSGPDQQPDRDEHHRRRDRRARTAAGRSPRRRAASRRGSPATSPHALQVGLRRDAPGRDRVPGAGVRLASVRPQISA